MRTPRMTETYGVEGSPRDVGASSVPVSAALRHKYRPGAWRYNARVACVFVPSLLMLVFSGGNAVVGTALTGTALVYVFDLLGSAEAAVVAVWVTAFALYVATVANGDVFASHRSAATSALLLLAHAQLLFAAAAWATLQFRWVQASFPGVTLACERFLFTVAPVIAGQVLGGWGASATFGARSAPWAQLAAQTFCFAAFSLPAESSFRLPRRRAGKNEGATETTNATTTHRSHRTRERASADRLILRDVDARTHAALFCAAPFLSYAATHKNTLFSFPSSSPRDGAFLFEHVCSSALLLAFPPALMCLAAKAGGVRWAFARGDRAAAAGGARAAAPGSEATRDAAASGGGADGAARARESPPTLDAHRRARCRFVDDARAERTRRSVTIACSAVSIAVFAFGALGRVLASGFREYVVLPSPYGVLAVAAAAYGGILACASFLAGTVPLSITAATLCVSAVAAAAAIGVPGWLWPAAAASAWGATRFAADFFRLRGHGASAKATDYALFVCGATACAARFLEDNFATLDVELDGMPIRDLTRFLLLNVTACLAAPGAALTSFSGTRTSSDGISPRAFGAALGLHALMFARCEDALHSTMHEDGTSMYPPYLMAVTTLLGVAAADALRARGAVTEMAAWFCKCVHVAKLFVLFVPGEDALVPCALVALAFSSVGVGGGGASRDPEPAYADKRRVAAEDLGRVILILGALVHARFVAFDVAFALTGRRPTDATVFGGLVLCASCGVAPLVAARYAHDAAVKRALAVVFASGAALVTLKPPMPWKGEADGFWYDEAHVPDFEPDDADVYGDRALGALGDASTFRDGWPTWALACAALAAAYCTTSKGAGDVVGGAGWAPLRAAVRAARTSRFAPRVAASPGIARARGGDARVGEPRLASFRRAAIGFALACAAFLETATLRSGAALAGGYAFGAYLGAETFPGAGRALTSPLRAACAACAWLLAHVASPETNTRTAGGAAWLAFGVCSVCLIAAWWSQRDALLPALEDRTLEAFGESSALRDEGLRREEARLGVLGAAAGLAAMVAFALKAAAGGSSGRVGGERRARVGGEGLGRAGGWVDDDDDSDDSDDSDSDSDAGSAGFESEDDSATRRRLRRRRPGGGPLIDDRDMSGARSSRGPPGYRAANERDGAANAPSPFAPFSGRRPAHLRGSASELHRRSLRSRRAEWMPALGNVAAVSAFLAGSALAARIAADPDTATFIVAPVLLMLHEDGALFPSLRGTRRYAPPLAAATTHLLGAALSQALTLGFGAPESDLHAAATSAWAAGEHISAFAKTRTFLVEASLALAAAPCAWRLTEYLWSPARRAGAVGTAALAPLNVLAVAAAESRAARTLAVTSLACAAVQHVAQRRAKRAGMRAL